MNTTLMRTHISKRINIVTGTMYVRVPTGNSLLSYFVNSPHENTLGYTCALNIRFLNLSTYVQLYYKLEPWMHELVLLNLLKNSVGGVDYDATI